MPNPYRCEQEIQVDEQLYRLVFNWNTAAEYEFASRETISQALEALAAGRLSAVTLRAMLWAGLRTHHRDVSIEQAGEMISRAGRARVVRVLADAMRYYFPDAFGAQEQSADPPSPPPST